MHGHRRELSAHHTDRFDPDAMLVRESRRKQRASLDGDAQARFVLKYALSQNPLQEQPGVRDLELWARLQAEFGDGFPVC